MPRFILPVLLALAGFLLSGQGAYIHAKAWLAQVLLERAFNETVTTGRQTKPWAWADTWPVARISEAAPCQRHRARRLKRPGAGVRSGPCRADAGCRRARRRRLFGTPRHPFPLPEKCRDRRRDRDHAKRRQAGPLPRRCDLGRALRPFRHRSLDRSIRTGSVDLLAIRCADAGSGALSAACDHDWAGFLILHWMGAGLFWVSRSREMVRAEASNRRPSDT